jgi:hypothetical protein
LLHSQGELGCNPSSLGTPEITAESLEVTPETRGKTYLLPEMFNILVPSGCEQHPGLRTVVAAMFSKGQKKLVLKECESTTHNPTPVTNTTSMEKAVLSRRSAAENHRQNCPRTRPVSTPCMKRPAMPGPNTSVWLCNKASDGVGGEIVELDMMSDGDTLAARRDGRSYGLEARR